MIYYPFWNASTCSTNVIIVTIISRTISMTNKIVFTFKINYVFNFKTWSKFLTFKFYLCVKIICSNVFNLLTQNHLFVLGKEVISNSFFSSFVAEGCSKLTIGRLLSCVMCYSLCFASNCLQPHGELILDNHFSHEVLVWNVELFVSKVEGKDKSSKHNLLMIKGSPFPASWHERILI